MTTVPINRGFKMEQAFRFRLNSCKEFESMFKLVIVLRAVERIGTEILIAESGMP